MNYKLHWYVQDFSLCAGGGIAQERKSSERIYRRPLRKRLRRKRRSDDKGFSNGEGEGRNNFMSGR